MSPSTKFRWRQAFTSLLLLAGATGAVWVVRDILRQDPARGLSNRNERPVTLTYVAVGDTFCLLLPRARFNELVQRSEPFASFCRRRLGSLLDLSRQHMQATYAAEAREVDVADYEPKMNVTPNAVATKD